MDKPADLSAYASMFRLDPKGFEALQETPPDGQVTTHTCPQGEQVICVQSRKLHSGRDPKLEAKRFARNQSLDNADLIVLLGYASGYVAHALFQRSWVEMVVYEPSLSILREGLAHTPPNPRIQIVTSLEALETYYENRFRSVCNLRLLTWPASARVLAPYFEAATKSTIHAVKRSQLEHNTHHFRSQGWLANYLENLPSLGRYPNITRYMGQFSKNPAIICSAGPSLNKNAELLKSLKGKCLIIAVNTAAKALASMGIEAHIIVSVESLDISSQLQEIPWLHKATAFLEMTGNPKIFEMGFESIVPVSAASSAVAYFSERLAPGQVFHAGQCVANAATAIAARLGCPGLVLLGQDLAYQDDLVYAKGTVFEEIRVSVEQGKTIHRNMQAKDRIESDSKGVFQSGAKPKHNYRPATLPAWGDPSKQVQSNEAFANFRDWFSQASDKLKAEGRWLVNATQGGAQIPGWQEMTLEDAIRSYELDAPSSAEIPNVVELLGRLAQEQGLPADFMCQELQKERDEMVRVVQAALTSRGWVNSDPDGDILAGQDVSDRINTAYHELRQIIETCPLLQAQIGQPLQAMMKRQQLNTFTISKLIEEGAATLDQRLEAIMNSIENKEARSRAAS